MHAPTIRRQVSRPPLSLAGAWRTGVAAGIASELTVATCSLHEAGSASAGVKATSHWLWGKRARRRRGGSIRYTLVGYAIHQLCSFLWSSLYAAWNARRPTASRGVQLRRAAVVGLLAAVVDYAVTPKRLRPGFEAQLSRASMAGVYAVFALGLYLAAARQQGTHARRHAEPGG